MHALPSPVLKVSAFILSHSWGAVHRWFPQFLQFPLPPSRRSSGYASFATGIASSKMWSPGPPLGCKQPDGPHAVPAAPFGLGSRSPVSFAQLLTRREGQVWRVEPAITPRCVAGPDCQDSRLPVQGRWKARRGSSRIQSALFAGVLALLIHLDRGPRRALRLGCALR